MSKQDKKIKGRDKTLSKLKGSGDRELCSLKQLLSLLSVAVSSPRVTTGNCSKPQHHLQRNSNSWNKTGRQLANEASELERFSITYRNLRDFSGHPLHKLFLNIFTCLVKNRLVCSEWFHQAPPDNTLGVLICLRLLIRDPHYQRVFHELQGTDRLAMHLELVSSGYLEGGEQTFTVEKLVNMTYVFQKLSATEQQRPWVTGSGAYKTLVKLLATRDSSVLLGSLLALTSLAESTDCKEKIGELPVVGNLLVVLQEYDLLSKRVCVELLRLLCPCRRVREQVRALDGVPVLLSLLHSDHLQLLWNAAWVLVQLCEDPEAAAEIRLWGGPQQLLRILRSGRTYISDRTSVDTLSSANAAGRVHKEHLAEKLSPQETLDNTLSLQAACCAALTELILDDTTAHQVVQENGVHIIGKLILPRTSPPGLKAKSLQCYAFRTLRFLFSVERNRPLFKRLFPAELFAMFIDVGHYVRDIAAYEALQEKVSLLSEEDLISLRDNVERVSLDRSPLKVVNGYTVLDHLGSGAFGSVFKVRKQASQNLFALKEVILHNPAFGKDKKDREVNVEKIVSELSIIKEQINHPNIVQYYKTFLENDKLYIVMELIEGAPLAEHFNSLKEKQQQFTEERVWKIFIQLCLALRYLHKEKRIIHRDLSPSNIMLGEKDKVTITDFGLAKQKEENSKLTSVVGTILYSCPEVVKSEPYGEKADVWALGCLLYHMVALRPPFYSTNMLSLATKIVEAIYEPVPEGVFSARVMDIIKWCLTPNADLRPDIVEVGARVSDLMMTFMDNLCTSHNALERKLERDRKRAQKYFLEANGGGATCCHLSLSQGEDKKHAIVCSDGSTDVTTDTSDTPHSSMESDPHVKAEGNPDLCRIQVPLRHTPDTPDTASSEDLDATMKSPWKGLSMGPVKPSFTTSVREEQKHPCAEFVVPKAKPRPASAGICVSQRKVREIDDPVQKLLLLLHKIIYISQLPPTLHHNLRRWAVERFKKSLFDQRSSPYGLKLELHKLLQASPDIVEQLSSDRWSSLASFGGKKLCTTVQGDNRYSTLQEGITYEQMLAMIEEELEENGYYSTSSNRRDHHPQ